MADGRISGGQGKGGREGGIGKDREREGGRDGAIERKRGEIERGRLRGREGERKSRRGVTADLVGVATPAGQ